MADMGRFQLQLRYYMITIIRTLKQDHICRQLVYLDLFILHHTIRYYD